MSKRPTDESVERAIAVVMAELPDLPPLTSFKKLAGGYANLVYDLNDRYILRVFFRQGWDANFAAELAALGMLRTAPNVPRVLASGILPLEWPCPYLLLSKSPGTNAFTVWLDTAADARDIWASEIAATLKWTHAVSLPEYGPLVERAGNMSNAAAGQSWQRRHDRTMADLLTLARGCARANEMRGILNEAEAFYAAHREALVFQAGPCLVHGDVRLHNVIVDAAHVTGVIDWEWAHGGEPEEDLVNIVRFALFPTHEVSGVDARATRAEYAPLLKSMLSAYPELREIPELSTRLTLYVIQADLGQLTGSEHLQRNAEERLNGWLREGLVEQVIG